MRFAILFLLTFTGCVTGKISYVEKNVEISITRSMGGQVEIAIIKENSP